MSKKLIIKFRCLCFFVRDEETRQMHVVTPATCGCEAEGGVEKHAAFLVFPKQGGRLNAAGNEKEPGEEGKVDYVEMEDWALFMPRTRQPAVLDVPASAVDLNAVTEDVLAPALVRGPRDARITSRITLPSGRLADPVAPGTWDFAGNRIAMARDVSWIVDDLDVPDGEPLVLRRSSFAVGQDPNPEGDDDPIGIPANSRGEFRIEFHHSMKGDFGRQLETRDPNRAAGHVKAYYTLYPRPAKQPIPQFVTSPDIGVVGCILMTGAVPPPVG
jgi:hypothetical protein